MCVAGARICLPALAPRRDSRASRDRRTTEPTPGGASATRHLATGGKRPALLRWSPTREPNGEPARLIWSGKGRASCPIALVLRSSDRLPLVHAS
jgi:hypothetical protein